LTRSIRIILADDHRLFRDGLRRILEDQPGFDIVAEAATGIEAVALAKTHKPDVAVVDVGMPELNGVEATRQILRVSPETAVLILSMHNDERYVRRSKLAGAMGYLLKDTAEEGLTQAIVCLSRGEEFFSPSLARFLDGPMPIVDDRYETLTERERQIYQMLAEGGSNKEIAVRLDLSLHTVETHRTRIMDKLGLHSISELVLSAVRRGLVH
jgi:two-component system, NarL family, response regulator NreC